MNGEPQSQQPQKCPRCNSLNTKFCYYNNYSLSQPRYFCKACRRYWTQGGTLRNVRIGGGCRKPKRSKGSASSSPAENNSALSLSQPPREAEVIQRDPSAASSASAAATPAVPSISPFYQGGACVGDGGYLSSLAAIESLNPSQPFSQTSLFSGFGTPSLVSSIRPSQLPFYQMGIIRDKEEEENLYEADQGLIQSTAANSGSTASTSHHHEWTESFISNNFSNRGGSDASLWSTTMSTVSTSRNFQQSHNDTNVGGSVSLFPNQQWADLPEYDPPP